MNVKLKRIDDAFNFEAEGSSPVKVKIDAAEKIGGMNNGARPMELILMGLGGCSAIDIILILKKQKQVIKSYDIEISAERYEDRTPAIFKEIKVEYHFSGQIETKKLERAILLSATKYCSVSEILKPTAKIEYYYSLNGENLIKVEE